MSITAAQLDGALFCLREAREDVEDAKDSLIGHKAASARLADIRESIAAEIGWLNRMLVRRVRAERRRRNRMHRRRRVKPA
jgi:hypothetical protein